MACAIEDTLEGGGGWGGMTFLTPLGHTCSCSSFPTHTPVRVRITRPGVAARSRASRGEASALTRSGHLLCNFLGMSIYEQRRQLAMSRGLERACAGAFRARGDKSPAGPVDRPGARARTSVAAWHRRSIGHWHCRNFRDGESRGTGCVSRLGTMTDVEVRWQ